MVTKQVPSIAVLQRRLYPCQSGSMLCFMRGKSLSCGTTPSTDCTYKSRGILVGGVQTVAAIANDESLQVRVRKAHPPEGRSSQHPSAPGRAKTVKKVAYSARVQRMAHLVLASLGNFFFVFGVLGVGAEWRSVPFLCLTFDHLSRRMFEVATCG